MRFTAKRAVPRLTSVDITRFVTYLTLGAWSVAFMFYPPNAFVSTIDSVTRYAWLGLVLLASLGAAVAVLGRWDLKAERAAVYSALAGPGLYAVSQVWYVLAPTEAIVDPSQRVALAFFAIFATMCLATRIAEIQLQRRKAAAAKAAADSLAESAAIAIRAEES